MDFLPRWIALEMTRRCNLDCVHCRSSAEPVAPGKELDTGEVLALMDAMAKLSSPALVLTGGEPLLRGDLFELLRYGTQRGLRMC
ncbi:MAG: radical SAM protein, partial [Deltaproteobacteria bacterium]|nr:radical SAM protein [Deltaproteobacteria bacterium]